MATQSLMFLLLGVQTAFVLGSDQLRDYGCPNVTFDADYACADECYDCAFGQEVCCPNNCGGKSCMKSVPVKSCTVGNKTIEHGGLIREVDYNLSYSCGDCLCEDGREKCFYRSCGSFP